MSQISAVIPLVVLAHMVGDYLIQNDWMAREKTKRWWPAIVHAVTYGIPFVALTQSPWALAVIVGTHAVIDRYRLARHFVWFRNQFAPFAYRPPHTPTGMMPGTAEWMSVWLLIIADNLIHILINIAAVAWL